MSELCAGRRAARRNAEPRTDDDVLFKMRQTDPRVRCRLSALRLSDGKFSEKQRRPGCAGNQHRQHQYRRRNGNCHCSGHCSRGSVPTKEQGNRSAFVHLSRLLGRAPLLRRQNRHGPDLVLHRRIFPDRLADRPDHDHHRWFSRQKWIPACINVKRIQFTGGDTT